MSIVFIISAPSGSGKSTLVRELLRRDGNFHFSISYTTRAPRGAEKPGESYHYISRQEFEEMIRGDEFLEWAEVFGHYYGTHRRELEDARRQGRDFLLDIDVQGARQLKEKMPDAVSIFILAPSRAELEKRLRARGEDSGAVIERRLNGAAKEIREYRRYDYILINDEVESAVRKLCCIVEAERLRCARPEVRRRVEAILRTFTEPETEAAAGEISSEE